MKNKIFKYIVLLLLFPLSLSITTSAYANVNDLKNNFTKIFFQSSLEYMEAQAYLLEALEMNDEASKTRKSIDFVKNEKKKEGKRLTNAFNTVSENSEAIEGALTKEAANSAEAKKLYAKALPHTVKGVIGSVKLPPEAKALLDALKKDKMAALKMGSFLKVLPKIPEYVQNATNVGKLIVSGAKSRDVEGAADATSAMGDL